MKSLINIEPNTNYLTKTGIAESAQQAVANLLETNSALDVFITVKQAEEVLSQIKKAVQDMAIGEVMSIGGGELKTGFSYRGVKVQSKNLAAKYEYDSVEIAAKETEIENLKAELKALQKLAQARGEAKMTEQGMTISITFA